MTPDAQRLVEELTARGETVATAESLTAGLLAATIADACGASAVLRGGFIVYATELKATLAGVDERVLREYGAVSEPTARALAAGARKRCGATWAVSLTGVAGPATQEGRPVGEVFCGVAGPDGVRVARWRLPGDRVRIRTGAVEKAIRELLTAL